MISARVLLIEQRQLYVSCADHSGRAQPFDMMFVHSKRFSEWVNWSCQPVEQ